MNYAVLEPYEIQVDPETGEVLTDVEIVPDELPRVPRRIMYDREELEKNLATIKKEIERLQFVAEKYQTQFEKRESYLLGKCQQIAVQTGQDKIKLAGFGTFRFQKGRESVSTEAYDSLEDSQKQEIHNTMPSLFKVKFSPDKKAIKTAIANGETTDYFTIEKASDKFIFKPEV